MWDGEGAGTDPYDSDGDGLPDSWEEAYGLDPWSASGDDGAEGDVDGDGLKNLSEYLAGTDPVAGDSDADGVNDYDDDADGDGLSNGDEQDRVGTDPGNPDTDDDGYEDGIEADKDEPAAGTDPYGMDMLLTGPSDFFSPHLFCLSGATQEGDTFARHFGVLPDTREDPFTGSATGGMAAYLWRYGLLETPRFIAQQGHWMQRAGNAIVEVVGERDAIETVKVGGQAITTILGTLSL